MSIFSCSHPTSQSNDFELTDYANQYKIVFRHRGLFSIKSDGRALEKIIDFEQHSQDFTVNKDYTKIAFSLGGEIYTMSIDGTNILKVTQEPSEESKLNPKFLPQEDALIYHTQGSLFRVNYDGSNIQQITPDSFAIASHNSKSLHANKIVFKGNGQSSFHLMKTDGSNLTLLSTSGSSPYNPAFSPDGEKILYTTSIGENREIFLMNTDGSGKINLSNSPNKDNYACWSPDGSMIFFESYSDNGYNYIYTVNPDGSGLRQLYSKMLKPNVYWFFPTWSPDLTRMAFSDKIGDGNARDTIFILDIESGLTKQLTNGIGNLIWIN